MFKTIINSVLTSPMNGKRAFISERPDEFDTSNILTISKNDYRYINKPISEDVNMNNRKIINCNVGTNIMIFVQ